jgi:glycosyltransferase involved in cell wall biosynthesis
VKKVLLISNKVFHYRVSNYNYFARQFRKEGIEFLVRASDLQKNNPYPIEFNFHVIPFGFFRYKREIERIQPDVVILFVHLKDFFVWPLIHWLKLKRIPIVYWNKGINLEVRAPTLRNQLFYYVHSRCDAILLYSKHNVGDIQLKNRHKVFIAANTINLDALPHVPQSKDEIKREYGIPFQKVVLFVGRMRGVKKVEHIIEAFNSIDEPGVGCVIVGDPMSYDLPSMIKKRNILYLGEIFDPKNERISRLFKASDVFCIPGDVGLGLNEAFHWGLPVVTEDGLQPPEIHYLTQGRNGFVVPEDDVGALRDKLLLLLRDDALRAQFSQAAREDIARVASIENMYSGFRDCVRALTSGPAAPRPERMRVTPR